MNEAERMNKIEEIFNELCYCVVGKVFDERGEDRRFEDFVEMFNGNKNFIK
jgi:hypothetical protein